MSFFEGILTGAATSIDTQLKKDMERTQERAEGMAQYRVTRRRAEIERQEKEKREVSDVLNKLAGLVGGDVDKAAQLYVSGGKSVSGGTALYDELKKNADAGKDISTAITFAEARAKPGQMTDYVSQFITPISELPPIKGEIKGAGLYGAMFKPDLAKSVMAQVDEEAPLTAAQKFQEGAGPSAAAIDRTGFLAAEEYGEVKKERERAGKAEERAVKAEKRAATGFTSAEERYKSAEARAVKAEKRASTAFSTDQDIKKAQEERAKAEEARRVSEETRKAKESIQNQKLTGLSIEEKQIALLKEKDHPEFANFEKMAVYASVKLNTKGLTTDQKNTYQQMLNDAIAGAKSYKNAMDDGDTAAGDIEFSKQSLDSIIQGAAKFELDKVPSKSIGDKIQYAIDGNESAYYGGMERAIETVEKRLTDDAGFISPQAKRYLASLKESNTQKLYNFAIKQQQGYTSGSPAEKKKSKFVNYDTFASAVKQLKKANTSLSDAAAIKQWARNNAKAGSVVPMNSAGTVFGVWTGSRFLQAKDMGR